MSRVALGVTSDVDVQPPAAVRGPSLKQKVLAGTLWTLFGYGASQVLRLASSLVLTRLLFPEAFGMMALVQVVMSGLAMFSDVGIQPALIQHKRGEDPVFVNTAWTIQVVRGLVLWLCASLLAWPASLWFQEPALRVLIPVASLTAVIAGFNSTALALLNRKLILGKQTLWDLVAQATTIIVTVLWAMHWPSVWALVGGGLAGTAVKVVLSHVALPGMPHRFVLDRTSAGELLRFGRWIFISTALTFLATYGDRMVLGRWMTKEQLGVYSVALTWATLAISVLTALGGRVFFPLYAELARGDIKQMLPKFRKARIGLMAITLPIPCLMVIAGGPMVRLLYDSRYWEAGWMLEVLAAGVVFQTVNNTAAVVLLARGETFAHMVYVGVRVGLAFLCMAVGGWYGGVAGIVFGVAAAHILCYGVMAVQIRHTGTWLPWVDLGFIGLCAGLAAIAKIGSMMLLR